jgi:tripartite-type tricarboxylate transporter receptor subunit TctC
LQLRNLFFVLSLTVLALAAQAQEWPNRPVRIIVPFPPGGAADALPRIIGERLSAKWNQPFVIENRAGATGTLGAEFVFRAEPDGYTLMSTPPAPLVINPSLYSKLPYDPTQFVPVTVMASIPSVMLVHPKVAAANVREFVEYARANPGRLNYASQGTTSVSFLTTEMFMAVAGGLKITHVPYKGTGPALISILAGETELFFDNLGTSLQPVRSGRLRALAVCSERRHPALPDVPAMSEIYPGFVSVAWFGVLAPPRTPTALAEKLSIAIGDVLKDVEVQKRLAALSAEPIGTTPAVMAAFLHQEAERWRNVIRRAGVKPGEP